MLIETMPARANKASDLAAVTASNLVLDLDNVYLSDRGWAYRHYKREDKSLYWDEILVAGEVADSDTPDAFDAAPHLRDRQQRFSLLP